MEDDKIHVMIVDDQELVRMGVESLLADVDDIEVCLSEESPLEVLSNPILWKIDVALIDAKMPMMSGVELISILQKREPHIASIMLTAFDEDQNLVDCIHAGGKGHLLKDASADAINGAIHTVANGGLALGSKEVRRMTVLLGDVRSDKKQDEVIRPADNLDFANSILTVLKEDDRAMALLVAQGKTNQEIARSMFISVGTVRNHLSRIFAQFGVRNRTELAAVLHGRY